MTLVRPTGSQVAFGRLMRTLAALGPHRLGHMRARGRETRALVGKVRRPGR